MSYKKNKLHAYKEIEQDLKSDVFEDTKAILLFGEEDYLVNNYEKKIVERFVEPATMELDYVKLDGDTVSVDEIIAYSDTLPMMSKRRVVIIDTSPFLSKSSGYGETSESTVFNEGDANKLTNYLDNLPETTMMVFTSAQVAKNRSLYKKITSLGKTYEFGRLERRDLMGFLKKKFKEMGKNADENICNEIINLSGYFERDSEHDLNMIVNDVMKIASYNETGSIALSDVSNSLETSLEKDVFALLDSISTGRKGDAMLLVENILGTGGNTFRLLSLIISQIEIMQSYKEYSIRGFSFEEIMKKLQIKSQYRLKKAAGFANKYSVEELNKMLSNLYEVDKNIKTGIYNDKLALTMFIAGI